VVSAKAEFNKAAGEANVKAAADKKPPAPAEGKAGYVGTEECSMCHSKEQKFWEATKHAGAWETLEKLGKEFNLDCTYCHVTGFGKPGGSNLAVNEDLRDVQCEICHGPGSIHVDEDGYEKPSTMMMNLKEDLCVECHSKEHSDTFDFKAYLRDVTGKGHAAKFRKKLGDGPTGKELREAGLKKAGAYLGAGCPK
jgi:RecJ-like exonuclease